MMAPMRTNQLPQVNPFPIRIYPLRTLRRPEGTTPQKRCVRTGVSHKQWLAKNHACSELLIAGVRTDASCHYCIRNRNFIFRAYCRQRGICPHCLGPKGRRSSWHIQSLQFQCGTVVDPRAVLGVRSLGLILDENLSPEPGASGSNSEVVKL